MTLFWFFPLPNGNIIRYGNMSSIVQNLVQNDSIESNRHGAHDYVENLIDQ